MIRLTVILGLAGSLAASVAAGVPQDPPPVALGSVALLVAERAFALFMIWLAVLIVLSRALRDQLPIEISTRGVRYAEAEKVRETAGQTEKAIRVLEADITWLRRTVGGLMQKEDASGRRAKHRLD